ncbi:GNAT family N-acetyltransferase [Macrococcus capreoli]|uniref:GNAT family N-acetyltransferase n=1 Tax=Macrococcus capreoli TaxID=2982690 RepID=UPI0021D5F8D9|nr:hypothetical protein [Macrococcus sp. TMW 2.2395]MCU7558568.1 hypothetical protein [Macrococcus sp. TMW 2.2395]
MTAIQIRKADMADVEKIEYIQNHALQVLKNAETLDPVPVGELMENIKQGLMAVALVDDEVAAFRTMHVPDEDYLGPYAGIVNAQEEGLIYSDITIVDPDYRGLSLQRKLGEWLFEQFEQDYKVIMATVHPDNIPSLKDKFHLGMHITAMDKLYGGKLRFIFKKEVHNNFEIKELTRVNIENLSAIEQYLNEGYKGISMADGKIMFGSLLQLKNDSIIK